MVDHCIRACVLCVHVVCMGVHTVGCCIHVCVLCVHACVLCVCVHACVRVRLAGVSAAPTRPLAPQSAAECSSLLRTLHGLEQEHLRRSLALQQEEDFAKARRQLAVFQRNELHSIFFAQIKSAIFKGDLKPEAAKMLLQDYSKIQVTPPATPL